MTTWPRSTSSRLMPRSSRPTLSPAWPSSRILRNISTPVTVVVCAFSLMPMMSTVSPVWIVPRSIRPVTTVPRPVIEKTSSTGIRNGFSISRTGCGIASSQAVMSSMTLPPHSASPSSNIFSSAYSGNLQSQPVVLLVPHLRRDLQVRTGNSVRGHGEGIGDAEVASDMKMNYGFVAGDGCRYGRVVIVLVGRDCRRNLIAVDRGLDYFRAQADSRRKFQLYCVVSVALHLEGHVIPCAVEGEVERRGPHLHIVDGEVVPSGRQVRRQRHAGL